ncbi:hypothetical protein CASFOL_032483 [Castilleja foliolosa]|uniref:Uncharacterized protein n=1 Tax=Castilleja foliolosa TaxID=1961234 RepID=A0ABD3C286_9LAMI
MAVVFIVFISLSCFLFIGLCLFAISWFLIKTRKNKSKQDIEMIRGDEHFKAKEDIVKGPFGSQAVTITIEDDKRFEGEIKKKDKKSSSIDIINGASSSKH